MKENYVYLNYYQAMAFIHKIDEMKKANPYFNNEIAKEYEKFVIKRMGEIVTTYPQIKLKIVPNANKFEISKSLLNYLTNLTSIDVFDKETMKEYKKIIKELEEKVLRENLEKIESKIKK